MPDVNKKINLDLNVRSLADIERLEKSLGKIESAITRMKKAGESTASLESELSTVKKLAQAYDKMAQGAKLTREESATLMRVLRAQFAQQKETERAETAFKQFQAEAARKEQINPLRSQWMRAGYSMRMSNMFSARGITVDQYREGRRGFEEWTTPKQTPANDIPWKEGLATAFGWAVTAAEGIKFAFKEAFNISVGIVDNFSEILRGVGELTDARTGAATFATGSSLITNRAARNLQLQYGLSTGQSFGLSTAGGMLGMDITSLEDLAYMNESQRRLLTAYMERYSKWFDRMDQSGALQDIQTMQVEFSAFKQELSMEWLSWIAQNKDVLLGAANGVLKLVEWVLNAGTKLGEFGGNIVSWFGSAYTTGQPITVNINSENNVSGVISDQSGIETALNDWSAKLAGQIATALG